MIEEVPDVKGLPWRYRLTAVVGFMLALLILRLPFWLILGTVRQIRRLSKKPASPAAAEASLLSVRWIARFYPGRAACLEVPLGAFIASALQGQRVTWCIGARFGPSTHHAWIEAEGRPVGEPMADYHWPFQAAVRI